MNDEDDAVDENDEDLRDDLRAGDPARSLPPLTPVAVGRLLEETMSEDPARPDPTTSRPPRRTALLVAAAAVVVAGVGGAWAVLGPDGSDGSAERAVDPGTTAPASPSAGAPAGGSTDPAPGSGPGSGPVTTLSIEEQGQARCMVPSAEVLAGKDVAVLGTVRSADDETVVLDVDRWYAGPPDGPETDTVEVDAVEPALQDLLLAPDLEPGEQYLISATNGLVSLCGFSGPATPELEALYAEAFA